MENFEAIRFVDNDFELNVRADKNCDAVWLTQEEIAKLFDVDKTRITRLIGDIYTEEELDRNSTCINKILVQNEGAKKLKHSIKLYNLDMIISIGYRVKSKRGIIFRRWSSKALKEYLVQGYLVNKKRIEALNKVIEVQNRMLDISSLNNDQIDLVNVIEKYTNALDLLDDYDHQCIKKPSGSKTIYHLEYDECRKIIDSMKFSATSNVFGIEKEKGKLEGILAAVNQSVYGQEVYPSLEEKSAHLLYFLVKDHPFVDGCKRIAATLFLEFLNKNHALVKNGKIIISNSTLVAITILTAESKPEEMDVIIKLIMIFLTQGE